MNFRSPLPAILLFILLPLSAPAAAQEINFLERLPTDQLDVRPPATRVSGTPGNIRIIDRSCRALPEEGLRRRIVDTAIQEWAYFGFSVDNLADTSIEELEPRDEFGRRIFERVPEAQAIRVADSIAGYWAATPDSNWIIEQQNGFWQEAGIGSRWRYFWSAAFISWVMCESGLAERAQFARAIAHHTYIDQAIRARDGLDQRAVYTAYDTGEAEIVPGDMLCRGSRPAYESIAERRRQLGQGARTHCDIVVKVDEAAGLISAIGGNVRGSVRLKLLPAGEAASGNLAPVPYFGRNIFSHLKLNAEPIEANALDNSPSMQVVESQGMQRALAGHGR